MAAIRHPTMVRVARLIHPDGTATQECSLAIDENGNVMKIVPDSQFGAFVLMGFVVEDQRPYTLMPLLADAHIHLGISDGVRESPEFHTAEVVSRQLSNYLYCGVGHVLSLGTDQPWVNELSCEIRSTRSSRGAVPYSAGCGFGAVGGWPPELSEPEPRFRPTTAVSARAQVRELARRGIKILKLWVDDFGGKVPILPLPVAKAIIDEAHRHQLKVCAHVFFEGDARNLISLGIDALAHSVRDKLIDEAFAENMVSHGVKLMPTLVREEATVAFSRDHNPYLADPFFQECAQPMLGTLSMQRSASTSEEANAFQRSFDMAMENLRRLSQAQVEICMGTDTGFRLKLPGFSQHRELQLMCQAGLSPSQALATAMKNNYNFFAEAASGLRVGQPAEFVLLDGNPIERIENTTRIRQVWRQGSTVLGQAVLKCVEQARCRTG